MIKLTANTLALFEIADWSGDVPLYGMSVSMSDGSRTDYTVTGDFNDWGEITRLFMFDPKNSLFHLLQANFTDNAEEITLYTINPTTGVTTSKQISGASTMVTGYDFHRKTGVIIFSTYAYSNNNKVGYNFYMLDPSTSVAKQISSYTFPSGNDDYTGWFHTISDDGTKVYRLGYKDVSTSQEPGLGITDISQTTATTQWIGNFTVPSGYDFYVSFNLYGDNFLSLAPENGVTEDNNLDLIQWNLQGEAKVIFESPNAHQTPYFGPIAEYVSTDQTTYSALVVANGLSTDFDRWAILVVNLQNLSASQELDISPWMIAGTDSVSGIGIPDN